MGGESDYGEASEEDRRDDGTTQSSLDMRDIVSMVLRGEIYGVAALMKTVKVLEQERVKNVLLRANFARRIAAEELIA